MAPTSTPSPSTRWTPSPRGDLGKVFAEGDVDMVLLAFGVLGDQAHDEARAGRGGRVAQTNYTGAVSAGW